MSEQKQKMEVAIMGATENFICSIDDNTIRTEDFFRKYQKLKNLQSLINECVKRVEGKVTEIMDGEIASNPSGKIDVMYGKVTRTFDKIEEKETFDSKKFQEENTELYNKYVTKEVKETKGKITITPNKQIKEELSNANL